MLPTTILTMAVLVAGAVAAPVKSIPTRSLSKRSTPTIGEGFTAQETKQIFDAHRDAMQLASYVVTHKSDDIMKKYFDSDDHQTVIDVFNKILDDDPQTEVGNSLLGDITIVVDYEDEDTGEMACDGRTMAELRDWETSNPKLIICAGPGFKHGGISDGYDGVDAVVCDNLDDRVSWKMETLGSILLHEYTHFYNLVVPPLSKETDDPAYGPFGTRNMDKSDATNNADSYSWLANENLWTILCNKEFEDATEEDGQDPHCQDDVCEA